MLISCSSYSPRETVMHEFISKFNKKVAQEKGLCVFATGSSIQKKIHSIEIQYVTSEEVDIAKARKLIIELTESFIEQINLETKLTQDFEILPFRNIEIGILFKNENNEVRIGKEGLSKVLSVNGKIYYSDYEYSTGRYHDIFIESYDDALKKNSRIY